MSRPPWRRRRRVRRPHTPTRAPVPRATAATAAEFSPFVMRVATNAASVAFARRAPAHERRHRASRRRRAPTVPRAVNRDRSGADHGREYTEREKKILPIDVRVDGADGKSTSAQDEVEIAKTTGASGGGGENASASCESRTGSESGGCDGRELAASAASGARAEGVDPITAASDAATARLKERLRAATGLGTATTTTKRPSIAVRKFEELEIEASALEALEAQMRDAVEIEDYTNAAALKRAAEALRATDATGRLCDAYARAIEENQFEDAVRLRDAGVGLCGWWAGVEEYDDDDDDDDDDEADGDERDGDAARAKANAAPTGVIMRISREHGRLVGSTFSPRDLADVIELNKAYPKGYEYDAGQPVLEILLQEDEDAPGGFRQDVVRLNYVPQSIVLASDEDEEDEDEDAGDAVATEDAAIGFTADASSESAAEEGARRRASREDIDAVKNEIKSKLLGLDPSSEKTRDDALEEISAMLEKLSTDDNEDDAFETVDDETDDETLYDIKRTTACLQQEGLHAFVLTSDDEMIPYDENDDQSSMSHRPFSQSLDEEIEGFLAAKWESMVSGAGPNALGAASHAALVNAVKDAAQEMFATHGAADNGLDADGEDDDDDEAFDEVSAEELLALIGQEAELARPLPSRVRFRRIDPRLASGSRNDVFNGLYVGAFGPHGPEVLRMVRGRWGDEDVSDASDCVTAIKLTGDENVPCGAASFRAKINKSNLIVEGSSYPEELGVLARYKGEGRVAKSGFADSHWVDGELLVLDGKGGALTGGAELGFVWAVPGERRLLILFSSLKLPDVDVSHVAG